MSKYRDFEVTVGQGMDERTYRISTEDGVPFRVESVFGGFLGRITYREVAKDGATWRKALRAAGIANPFDTPEIQDATK